MVWETNFEVVERERNPRQRKDKRFAYIDREQLTNKLIPQGMKIQFSSKLQKEFLSYQEIKGHK